MKKFTEQLLLKHFRPFLAKIISDFFSILDNQTGLTTEFLRIKIYKKYIFP